LTIIKQFDFELVHGNADGLSRKPDANADTHQGASTAVRGVTVEQTANDADAPNRFQARRGSILVRQNKL